MSQQAGNLKKIFQTNNSKLWISLAVTKEYALSIQVRSTHLQPRYFYIQPECIDEFRQLLDDAITFIEFDKAFEARDQERKDG